MASHGSLPLYYKNSKPTGLSGPAKSWKDNYLLVVVFVGFIILIAGTFWFLPPLEDKDADYEKTYGRFTGNPAAYITDPVIPSEPTLEPPEVTEKEKPTEKIGVEIDEVVGMKRPEEEEGGRGKERGRDRERVREKERGKEEEEGKEGGKDEEKEREDGPKQTVHVKPPSEGHNDVISFRKETDPPSEPSRSSETVRPVVGGASNQPPDPEAEERKRKVVEVCTYVVWLTSYAS